MRSCLCTFFILVSSLTAANLRLGIIGTDTSHSVAFSSVLNDPSAKGHVAGARIVAAFQGGSPDIKGSASRVAGFTEQLKDKSGVRFYDSIGGLCNAVDGLLLESVDGRKHLDQFRQAATCGKPVFIDKPLASTLAGALEIARLAQKENVPWFSASSLRYTPLADLRDPASIGAMVWAPGPTEPHHQLDLSWYGIHGVEMLYTLLGPGCEEVSRISSSDSDVITGRWRDGKLGTIHLQRPYGKYGAIVFLNNRQIKDNPDIKIDYVPLLRQIVEFMQTKKPPVPHEVTLEMFAFMDAAQRSLSEGGKLVKLLSVDTP